MGWSLQRKTGLTFHSSGQSYKGYTLLAPLGGAGVYLIDMQGQIAHRWRVDGFRIFTVELLATGRLLVLCADASEPEAAETPFDQPPPPFAEQIRRLGGHATHLRELDWDGNLVWEYQNPALHHDFVRSANGNTLLAEWVEIPSSLEQRVLGGVRRAGEQFPAMLSDDIIEINPSGDEIRRLHLWQLLDPVEDAICPLEMRWEWTHLNSLALLPNGDIVFSCRSNSRIGVIDRAGGTLRWKFGAPEIVHQHHATVVGGGNIQVFDNGMHRIGNPYSRVVEVDPQTSRIVWEYAGEPREQFFSGHISGAQRLPNGNVLVCEGTSGRVFEVTPRGETVWEWISPFVTSTRRGSRSWLFRVYRYSPDFPGLAGKRLDPGQYADLSRLYGL